MAYSDQKYYARPEILVLEATNFGTNTSTASGQVVTGTSVAVMPKFVRATKVTNVKAVCTVIPNTGNAGTTLVFLNGTNTFASIAVGTASANQVIDATMTAANVSFAAAGQPTVNVVTTATVSNSGLVVGSYRVYFEETEAFA